MKRANLTIGISLTACYWLLAVSLSADGNDFFAIIEKSGLKYNKPDVTVETAVIPNSELNYEYALKDTVNKIEIRYLIYPLADLVKQYNGPHADTGIAMIDPNFLHTNFLLALSLKAQGKEMNMNGGLPDVKELSHAKVDLEYNADWGAMVDIQPCDEFAQQYKYCTILGIHKDNAADVFVMYLYNNKDTFEESVKQDLYSLVFKKS